MNEQQYKLFRLVIFGLCIFAAAMLLIPTLSQVSKSIEAKHWQIYKGVIISLNDSNTGIYAMRYGNPGTHVIEYEYEIHGNVLKGNVIGYGMSRPDSSLRSGDLINVYVNPDNNTEAVIAVGISKGHLFKLVVSFAFVALGAFLWRRM
jgi:hypothetical protein